MRSLWISLTFTLAVGQDLFLPSANQFADLLAVGQDLLLPSIPSPFDENVNLTSGENGNCIDVPPAGSSYSCAQQKGWGKCSESWMKGHCCKTCFNCQGSQCGGGGPSPSPPPAPRPVPGPTCADVPPSGKYSCALQKMWGKCSASWMQGHCCKTCFNCQNCQAGPSPTPPSPPSPSPPSPSPPTPGCQDVAPAGKFSCTMQKMFGKCSASWMQGHCCKTCFQCKPGCGGSGPSPPAPPPSPPAPWPAGSALPAGMSPSSGGRCGIEGPDSTRKEMQAKIANACHDCSGGELATVMAMAMIESDKMDKTDTSKGSSSGKSNWSPWNMNLDQLEALGCDIGCARGLGQSHGSYNIPKALGYLLTCLRGSSLGSACDCLHYHRYGSTGWKSGKGKGCGYESSTCKGCSAYAGAVADGAKQILANHKYAIEGYRVCEKVQHVR